MYNEFFAKMKYNYGWELNDEVTFFEKTYLITVSAKAYSENELITEEQKQAYRRFKEQREKYMHTCEALLHQYNSDQTSSTGYYIPSLLLIQKDGEFALIFDDANDTEGGLAICLEPQLRVFSVDAYL